MQTLIDIVTKLDSRLIMIVTGIFILLVIISLVKKAIKLAFLMVLFIVVSSYLTTVREYFEDINLRYRNHIIYCEMAGNSYEIPLKDFKKVTLKENGTVEVILYQNGEDVAIPIPIDAKKAKWFKIIIEHTYDKVKYQLDTPVEETFKE